MFCKYDCTRRLSIPADIITVMNMQHQYAVTIEWVGDLGEGTLNYKSYSRDHLIMAPGKLPILASSDKAFRGDDTRWNPEELLVASLSACHQLWYLHLCADAGIEVHGYVDNATGVMVEEDGGAGQFVGVTLRPHVVLASASDEPVARKLHEQAARRCFIARSVKFPVEHEPAFSFGSATS